MKDFLTIDAHSDTIFSAKKQNIGMYHTEGRTHMDLKSLVECMPHIQFFALYSDSRDPDSHYFEVFEGLDFLYNHLYMYNDSALLIGTGSDLKKCLDSKKIGVIAAIEGSYMLANNLYRLEQLYRLGIRCLSLTWNQGNSLSGGIGDNDDRGLSQQGKEVVATANRLGIIIDVSHISRKGFWDIINMAEKPVLATHSNCYSLCSHQRNLDDSQIKAIGNQQGVVCINFVPDFLGKNRNNISGIADHIEYAVEMAGPDCVGLGSDFDGTEALPESITGCNAYYLIKNELLKRKFSQELIEKIMGGNLRRVIETVI